MKHLVSSAFIGVHQRPFVLFRVLVRNASRAMVLGIGPAIVGDDGCPAGAAWILVVGVAAETFVEFAVLAQLFAIQFDAEAGLIGHPDRSVFVAHPASLNHIVRQMMVV